MAEYDVDLINANSQTMLTKTQNIGRIHIVQNIIDLFKKIRDYGKIKKY